MEYTADRSSVDKHKVPEWYHNAKFGIFIHWSLSCVPAYAPSKKGDIMEILKNEGSRSMLKNQPYSEWYLNSLRIKGSPVFEHHKKAYGEGFDYYEFAKTFNGALDSWNPADWADRFKQAGAKYVVLVTKHHDGFLLWPSKHLNPMRPELHASRNIVEELTEAVKARDMHMGFYYSSPYDWTFTKKPVTDLASAIARIPGSKEYRDYVNSHWYELIDDYDPAILWSDIGYPAKTNINEIFAYFYNKTPEGVVNERWGQAPGSIKHLVLLPVVRQLINRQIRKLMLEGKTSRAGVHCDFETPEYITMPDIKEKKWECVRGIGKSFGYTRDESEEDYMSVFELVQLLADIVSKNGNFLLNVGPKLGGEIPETQRERIAGIGKWLSVNGDAIYGTRPWKRAEGKTTDGLDVRFTSKEGNLYAIFMEAPQDSRVTIEKLKASKEMRIELPGYDKPLDWEQDSRGIRIEFEKRFSDRLAVCIKMTPEPSDG